MSINNVVLIGRLVRDPELRYSPSGTAISNFTLAVDRPRRQGQDNETDFIPVVCFKATAEAVANFLRKGKLTAVEGRIQTRNYDNNEGRKVFVTEIIADNVRFLERNEQQGRSPAQAVRNSDPFADDGKPIDISDDSLPF